MAEAEPFTRACGGCLPVRRRGQADSHNDEAAGIRVLENGLARHADAPPAERVYLAELRLRTGDRDAAASLLTEIDAAQLTAADRERLAADLATATEVAADLRTGSLDG